MKRGTDSMRRYATVLLLLALSLVILSSYGTSAVIFDPGNFTRMGQDIDLFQFQVNKTAGGGKADLNAIELNYTGTNTTPLSSLISNMTVWNTTTKDNVYGYNTSPGLWIPSGSGYLFNVSKLSNKAGEINANFTKLRFNMTLEPGPTGDGSTINFTVNNLYSTGNEVEPASETLPWPALDRPVFVDESPPNVSIISPVRSANLSGAGHLLNATVTNHTVNGQDSGVNRSAVQYGFDNASLGGVFGGDGSPGWTLLPHWNDRFHNATFAVSGLQGGEYRLRVRANDTVGIGEPNVNDTVWVNVTVDNTLPTIIPRLPLDGANISGRFSVNATWSDALTGVETQQYNLTNITGGTYEVWRSGALNDSIVSTTLKEGVYNVSYNATDFAGNTDTSVSAVTFTVDNTPPTITIHHPLNDSYAVSTLDLNVTVDEPNASRRYSVDGGGNTTFAGNTTLTSLPDGTRTVTVYANDTAGNINNTARSFTVDTTPPLLTPTLPVQAANLSGNFMVNATRNDATTNATTAYNLTNITNGVYTVWKSGSLNDTVDSTTLNDGVYNISYNATDFVGNTNASVYARTITVDNTNPGITPRLPVQNANLSGTFAVEATWSDTGTGVENASFNMTQNGVLRRGLAPLNGTVDSTTLSDGTYNISYSATDFAGNTNASVDARTVTIDNTPPAITVTSPNTTTRDDTPWLNATTSEAVDTWLYRLDTNTSNSTFTMTSSFTANTTLPVLQDGEHNVTVYANDSVGNMNGSFHNFTVDTSVPLINVHAPVKAANLSGTFLVNATASGDLLGIATRQFNITNETGSFLVGTWNASVDSQQFADGTYNLSFNASDILGNVRTNVDARTVTIDNTDPNIIPRLPVNGTNVSGRFSVNATWNDSGSGVTEVGWYNLTLANGSFDGFTRTGRLNDTVDSSTLEDAQYWVSYNVSDAAGNVNESLYARGFTVDNTPPQFALNATNHSIVEPFAWTNLTNVTLAAEIEDVRGLVVNRSGALNLSLVTLSGMIPVSFNATGSNGSVTTRLEGVATFLQHGVYYNGSAAAEDVLGNRNSSMNWSFRTDFNQPRNVTITDSFGAAVYNEWFKENRTVQIGQCFEPANESGVDAAAVLLDGVYRDWNTAIRTQPFNVTLNASGEKTYTFACRDVAGNANTSFNRTYRIDALPPSVTPVNPSQDETGVSTSFTFNASLHDERQESFLNVSASSVVLKKATGQAGTLSAEKWTNDSVTADVSSLDNDDPYTIRVSAVDNVGHNNTLSIDFRTKSSSGTSDDDGGDGGGSTDGGGGGTTTTTSLDITAAPGSVTVVSGRSTTFSVTVANDGDTNLAGIELGLDAPTGFTISGSPTAFGLDAGDQQTVDAELSVDAGTAANMYEVTLDATADDGTTATQTLDVTVEAPRPNLTLVNPPTEVDVPVGENTTARFTIRNRGTARASGIVPGFTVPVATAYVGGGFGLGAGQSRRVTVNFTARISDHIGVYGGRFTVTHSSKNLSHPVTVKVQPGTDAEKEEISRDIGRLRDRFNRVRNQLPESESDEVQRLLQEASTAAGEGDYATAADRRDTIRQRLQGVESRQNIILPAIVVAAIIVLLGLLFFFFPPREIWREIRRRLRKEEGYRPRTRGQQRRASLREKMEKSRTDLLRESFETAVESAKEGRRKKEEEQKYEYRR